MILISETKEYLMEKSFNQPLNEPYFKQYLTPRQQIGQILDSLPAQDALDLINSIAKERKRHNAMRISKGGLKNVIDAERFDLVELKRK